MFNHVVNWASFGSSATVAEVVLVLDPFIVLLPTDPVSEDELPASCQAGIAGRPVKLGTGEGDEGKLDPLLRRRALRDLNSCWSSASD